MGMAKQKTIEMRTNWKDGKMNEYYKKKAKDSEELIACWCWMVIVLAIIAVCVVGVQWIASAG